MPQSNFNSKAQRPMALGPDEQGTIQFISNFVASKIFFPPLMVKGWGTGYSLRGGASPEKKEDKMTDEQKNKEVRGTKVKRGKVNGGGVGSLSGPMPIPGTPEGELEKVFPFDFPLGYPSKSDDRFNPSRRWPGVTKGGLYGGAPPKRLTKEQIYAELNSDEEDKKTDEQGKKNRRMGWLTIKPTCFL